ncbi:MAG: energy-coupling factor ABC transporter ATP-binding protein, partial [Lachnospiraceae bacterium]|nr:energy-coupling factor ABC transporter ATP-binding protein [Lachnospiraceae bacterium]
MYFDNILTFKNVTFQYPETIVPAIKNISFTVGRGEFVVLCGQSGSGKSTLLCHMKKNHIPFGKGEGEMIFCSRDESKQGGFKEIPIEEMGDRESAMKIGFVLQDPEAQLVTDKVWHELAFGLENLGVGNSEINRRVAEMSEYFGISKYFRKNVKDLSGGEKQLIALASIMVMQPELLILDEPLSQLDPIARRNFINMLVEINREFSTTVILSEQYLEEVIPVSDRVLIMHDGELTVDAGTRNISGKIMDFLVENGSSPGKDLDVNSIEKNIETFGKYDDKFPIFGSLPIALKAYIKLDLVKGSSDLGSRRNSDSFKDNDRRNKGNPDSFKDSDLGSVENSDTPISIKEGRRWLSEVLHSVLTGTLVKGDEESNVSENSLISGSTKKNVSNNKGLIASGETVLSGKNLTYYFDDKKSPLLKDLNINIPKGAIYTIMGGNGSGKTTLLKILSGIIKPKGGKVYVKEKVGYLTQNPLELFTEITVEEELAEVLNLKAPEIKEKVNVTLEFLELLKQRKTHPYDLSGGEKQRLALGKLLLTEPDIILLDEPTKGLDSAFREKLISELYKLNQLGKTIVIVTHDMEFAAKISGCTALLFDGRLIGDADGENEDAGEFFLRNRYFTTA